MTNEYDWIDSNTEPGREYGAVDFMIGWFVYAAVVVYLVA